MQRDLALAVAGLHHGDGHAGQEAAHGLLLLDHQRGDAGGGALRHQHDARPAHGAVDEVLGLRVHGGRLLGHDPAAAQRGERGAGGAGAALELGEPGAARLPVQDDDGGEHTERDRDEQPRDPVVQQEADDEADDQGAQEGQQHPQSDLGVVRLGHGVGLLELGDHARALRGALVPALGLRLLLLAEATLALHGLDLLERGGGGAGGGRGGLAVLRHGGVQSSRAAQDIWATTAEASWRAVFSPARCARFSGRVRPRRCMACA
ncbi:Uncharacterised protein [Streptococcus pneumoniae]|nr:Uncharacterised protein [Streptococcus pneumoniae]